MEGLFYYLSKNPYVLLFLVLALGMLIGRIRIRGYALGRTAAAMLIGCFVASLSALYGFPLSIDVFTQNLFYYLFMYVIGLRLGPSFFNTFKGNGHKFAFLAFLSTSLALAVVVGGAWLLDLPLGAAAGILGGSQTMAAVLGTANQAVLSGAVSLPADMDQHDVLAMIAFSYGLTYIWGTTGIIIICKHLPRWWGVDIKAAATAYEKERGIINMDDTAISGYTPFTLRTYCLDHKAVIGRTVSDFHRKYPLCQIVSIHRGSEVFEVTPDTQLQRGDIVSLGGDIHDVTDLIGVLGPEVVDESLLSAPLDQAVILVTNPAVQGRPIRELLDNELNDKIQITSMRRGGAPWPLSLETRFRQRDLLFVTGTKSAVTRVAELFGQVARPSASTDLLTLSVGMILGLFIGQIPLPMFGTTVPLGNAVGLLISGLLVSFFSARLPMFGYTPSAARNILQDLGMIVFVAIIGINAGAVILEQLTGIMAVKILLLGFVGCSLPPFAVWAVGYYLLKINPAVLIGGVAGTHNHSGPCQEIAKDIDSSVPWLGFPVGYAVSGIFLTLFGYLAILLSS